jgi:hypothetical protein
MQARCPSGLGALHPPAPGPIRASALELILSTRAMSRAFMLEGMTNPFPGMSRPTRGVTSYAASLMWQVPHR